MLSVHQSCFLCPLCPKSTFRYSSMVWIVECGWKCLPLPGLAPKIFQEFFHNFSHAVNSVDGSEVPLNRLPTNHPLGLWSKGEINSAKPLQCCDSIYWHMLILFLNMLLLSPSLKFHLCDSMVIRDQGTLSLGWFVQVQKKAEVRAIVILL